MSLKQFIMGSLTGAVAS